MRRLGKLALILSLSATNLHSATTDTSQITKSRVEAAEKLIGLEFTPTEIDSMISVLEAYRTDYDVLRASSLDRGEAPSAVFSPIPGGMVFDRQKRVLVLSPVGDVALPKSPDELAFLPVRKLGELIRTRQITSTELTQLYLSRLRKYGPELQCIITLTEQIALQQAAKADQEIASGLYRGPLHGIPYGVKDLFDVAGSPTTFGAAAFRGNTATTNAAVIDKLTEAGAVLVAKLSMGELAWGDVWYGGMTRNPWNIRERSAGSSAGPASATAAGLVPFAIGTETWGSIISPSTRCGVTGFRPTFGRVSRTGAMPLSWSIDKVGPICRDVEDCAIVLSAIEGPDGKDRTVEDMPFNYSPGVDIGKLRIGYLKTDFDNGTNKANDLRTLQQFRKMGARLIPIELPKTPVRAMELILTAEAAASFDDLTRSNRDDQLAQQMKTAWPNLFRASRFIPAVEYIQATRLRQRGIEEMSQLMKTVDLFIAPTFDGSCLFFTNLTGHPAVVLPNGFDKSGIPTSVTMVGRLFDEATLLAAAKEYQDASGFHLNHPPRYYHVEPFNISSGERRAGEQSSILNQMRQFFGGTGSAKATGNGVN